MKLLEKYKQNKACIRIYRHFDANPLNGIIIDYSDDYVLLKYEYDFFFDGHRIVRRKDIARLKYNKTDRFHDGILNRENEILKIAKPVKINIDTGKTIIESLERAKMLAIYELEAGNSEEFILGYIKSIDGDELSILSIGSDGKYQKTPVKLPIAEITMFQIGNRYLKMFKKYSGKSM